MIGEAGGTVLRHTLFCVSDNRYALEVQVLLSGTDVVVHLAGGDRPHVGSVALASGVVDRPEAARSLVAGHHKEDVLTRQVATKVANRLGCTVAVSAGIHYDELERSGVDAILCLAMEAAGRAVDWVASVPREPS